MVAAFAVDLDEQERLIIVAEVERKYLERRRSNQSETNPNEPSKSQTELESIASIIRQAVVEHHQLQVDQILLIKPGSIPKTSSGKIQRHACRTGFLQQSLDVVFTSGLARAIERGETSVLPAIATTDKNQDEIAIGVITILNEAMQEIGGCSQINLNSTLQSNLGLDSLGVVELAAKLERAFGIKIDEQNLPIFHSVGDLVAAVRQALTSKNTPIVKSSLAEDLLGGDRMEKVPPPRGFLTRLTLSYFRLISQMVWGLEVSGLEHLPATGPFILCPNHESHLDVFWIAACLHPSVRRNLCSFAKREHFDHLSTRLFASIAGGIPIDRQGDVLPAIRAGHKALCAGRPLLIHPEGTRTRTGELLPFRRGPAKLALATGAPLIPVRIIGAYSIFPAHRRIPNLFSQIKFQRQKLRIVFGVPILPPSGVEGWAAENQLTQCLREAVENLGN